MVTDVVASSVGPAGAFLLAGVLAFLAACGGGARAVQQNAVPRGNNPYQSYAVLDHAVGASAPVDTLIVQNLHHTMGLKGYERRTAAEADLLVSYKVLTSGERAPVAPLHGPLPSASAFPNDVRGAWGVDVLQADFVAPSRGDASREKVLLVTLQDTRTFRVVWLGWTEVEFTDATLHARTSEAIGTITVGIPEVQP